ncbi:Egg cell-secreted protein 1.1 [Apostasia shenzhenica]|uniref:Egg cell-secreted protein 1.1 n=1 Tax=Apostasia shenzhenica TaxID=1088818 RepID=A0A2I0BD04_9ASPA|nr:Egg cell-secreted protein 1.1 [Apostasia shenzhenica]
MNPLPPPRRLLSPLLLLLLFAATLAAGSRPIASFSSLEARLGADEAWQCWESLVELRSCSGEVILFFLNGETYLGPSCCRAIRVIEKRCWAADAMLAALGFTSQEGDVLRGYCDAAAAAGAPSSSPGAGK